MSVDIIQILIMRHINKCILKMYPEQSEARKKTNMIKNSERLTKKYAKESKAKIF